MRRPARFELRPRSLPLPLTLAALVVALSLVVVVAASASETPSRFDRREALVPPTTDGQIPLIIESASAEAVAARVEELGGRVQHVFRHIDALSATLPVEAYDALLADARVGEVQRQRFVRPAVVPLALPGADAAGLRSRRSPDGIFFSLPPDRLSVRPVSRAEAVGDGAARGAAPISFLGYEAVTLAHEVWEAADFGDHTITAIIDTGVFPDHFLYPGSVIGGFNLVPSDEERAIDLDEDGHPDNRSFPWDSVHNHSHGTFVAGLIAGHSDLVLPEDDSLVQTVHRYSPESVVFDGEGLAAIRLMGTAPETDLFAVKVFPYDGGSAPDARVAAAIDRLITMKWNGNLDTDVINMSLSGPVLFDGWNPLDLIVNVATLVGITVVSAASNDGPSLVTVGSPASALTGLAVGATIDPIHIRTAVDFLFPVPPGAGFGFYPNDVLQVTDFSSRGLTGDGRVKPDLVASGLFMFSSTLLDVTGDGLNDVPSLGFGSGTSFAAPAVAGGAALITAFARHHGPFGRAPFVAHVLEGGAEQIIGYHRASQREQGRGFLQLPRAAGLMKNFHIWPPRENRTHVAQRNHDLADGSVVEDFPDLIPGQTFSFNLKVPRGTKKIDFAFPSVHKGGNQNPFFGDQLGVGIHSAKRGGAGDYVFFNGDLVGGEEFTYEDPEPGTLRLTMVAGPGNYSPVRGSIAAYPTQGSFPAARVFRGSVVRNGHAEHELDVPDDLEALGIMLSWQHDWTTYPTSDLDLGILTPDGPFALATIDSPELVWIEDPEPGLWQFRVYDVGTVIFHEHYALKIAFEEDDLVRGETTLDLARPRLQGASPNPFPPSAPATKVSFNIPKTGAVKLRVYDVTGRLVRTLVDAPLDRGAHEIRWDGRSDLGRPTTSGVYFLRLETEQGSSSRKLVRLD